MYKNYKQLHQILVKHYKVFNSGSRRLPHYIYPQTTLESVEYQHKTPTGFRDRFAYYCIKFIRGSYDMLTAYDPAKMTERKWLNRCIILQSVAGVPGMVGGMARHLRSLRTLNRDNGWIHHLLEQADNQRFHLLTFLNLRRPTILERGLIIAIQGIFMNSFFISYVLNPKFSHRLVGYLEEQAVKTYTAMLKDIDSQNGPLKQWRTRPAPKEAIDYYHLPETATFRDVVLCIRADEACHRETNHFLSDVDQNFDIAEEKVKIFEEEKR